MLDGYYFINKLKYSCVMVNWQSIVSEQFSIPFYGRGRKLPSRFSAIAASDQYIYLQNLLFLSNPSEDHHLKHY